MGDFSNSGMNSRNLIKLRGLPWDVTPTDILDFLKDVEVINNEKGIYMAFSPRDGRPNGEAFLELATPDDVDKAFSYNKNMLGRRYIEIFNAKPDEFENCLRRQNVMQQDTFIKLRGLPFSCRLEDIENFFSGLEIRNGKSGIYIVYDSHGRMSGEAFVQFRTSDDAENALKRNREKIGHRYIEIFRSSASECRRSAMFTRNMNNSNFGGNNGGGFGGNDRMSSNRGSGSGPGPRNMRNNFRDRPYPMPDQGPWNSSNDNHPWRNNNSGNNNNSNNMNNRSYGNNNSNDGFNSKMFTDNFNDFGDRNWKSNNSNNGNDRGFGNNNMFNNDNFNDFIDRNWKSNNNSNNSSERGFFNGGGGGGGNNSSNMGNNFGNNNSNNNGGPYLVHLRGMPYNCHELEIRDFFAPLKLVSCQVLFNNGRHTGEADAYFATVEDAQEAMKKHKEKMGSRYIELFANRNSDRRGRF